VTFTPLLTGARTGQVTIASNDPGSPVTAIGLTGQGTPPPAPNATLSPTSLAFPTTTALQASAPQTATLTNTGGSPLAILSVDVLGSGFQVSNDCGASLASLASCKFTVKFLPPAAGTFAADVRIVTNVASGPTVLRVTGTGTAAPLGRLAAAPASLAFGDQVLGTTSAPQTLTVTNSGDAVVSISRTAVTGDFSVESSCFDIRPGQACLLNVAFTPSEEGVRSGQIILTSDASNPTLTVGLSGRGTPLPVPRVQLSASALGYGNTMVGSRVSKAVTVTNTGGADLVVGAVTATGDFLAASGCTARLRPGQSCSIDVTFAPTIPGQRGGEVAIASNATGSPNRVSLAGVGCRFALTGRSFALVCSP
jgi:hypothetical protein